MLSEIFDKIQIPRISINLTNEGSGNTTPLEVNPQEALTAALDDASSWMIDSLPEADLLETQQANLRDTAVSDPTANKILQKIEEIFHRLTSDRTFNRKG